EKVHFKGVSPERLENEMENFIKWFNDTALNGENPLPPLARSAIAHLYFVSIHPYDDGNGRMARALSNKALYQSIGKSLLFSIASEINDDRKNYYMALEDIQKSSNIQPWIDYFSDITIKAQQTAQKKMDFVIEKTKLFDEHKNHINERQNKVLNRMFKEGIKGFKGGLSAKNYMTIADTTSSTTTRDLKDLVNKGVLFKKGEKKGSRYFLNIPTFAQQHCKP
ncbi:MAG: Fic family protein, partial [Alphaproteobacteria bacterium]|nr:Fic family protein [Alphaproteobacteria bacterium]